MTKTYKLYENNPLTCTFGLLNPIYVLKRQDYCKLISDPFMIEEVKKEKEEEENPDPDPDPDPKPDPDKDKNKVQVSSLTSNIMVNDEV